MNIAEALVEKLKELASSANKDGIPVPMVRDPKTGKGSATLTMVVVSFGVAILLLGGKAVNLVGTIDYNNVLWLLGVTLSAYLGRKFQGNGKDIQLGDTVVNSDKVKEKLEGNEGQ
jgi:hypothetical protein